MSDIFRTTFTESDCLVFFQECCPKGRDHMEDLGVDDSTILNWILRKSDGRVWTGLAWFRIGAGGGLL
jgi:hypothetical protein